MVAKGLPYQVEESLVAFSFLEYPQELSLDRKATCEIRDNTWAEVVRQNGLQFDKICVC